MSDTTDNDGSKPVNNESVNEMTDENFAVLQQEIKALYQQQHLERPPEAIDAAILAQAKLSAKHAKTSNIYRASAQAEVVKVNFWNKHRVGLSTAASVMIVASVMLLNPSFNQHAIIDADDSIPLLPASDQPMPMSVTSDLTPPAELIPENESAPATASKSEQVAPMSVQPAAEFQQKAEQMNPSSMPLSRSGFDDPAVDATPDNVSNSSQYKPLERSQVKIQAAKVESDFFTAPIMEHDSAPKAIAHLAELVESNQLVQAEHYLMTIEQRFPNIVNLDHPQHQQYQQLKQRLTTQ
ncbi:hypothetical protein [Shewanella donghaensis]|uniref:hypothetical protein n=1 Tax=Shewanella donghaensis TaxID=238836 RepID=UPI001182CBA0|nr:hypothetical protein [Shewanella donghaensis]